MPEQRDVDVSDLIVVCPHCGQSFPINAALSHQAWEQLLASREDDLRDQGRQELGPVIEELRQRLRERDQKVDELTKQEIELRKQRRDLEDEKKAQQLEVERARDEIRKEEKEKAGRDADARYRAQLRDRDETLRRTREELEDVRRKADIRSAQQEGVEAQRILGDQLQERFPQDDVRTVRQGQRGADVIQVVCTAGRRPCGKILWESKTADNWSNEWVEKLKRDRVEEKADIAVILSRRLPDDLVGSGRIGDVWVCTPDTMWHIAPLLRAILEHVARYRAANATREDTAGRVYDYLTTGGFGQHLSNAMEALCADSDALAREKRGAERQWAERQKRLERAARSLEAMLGDLDGLGAELSMVPQLAPPAATVLPGA